MPALLTKNFINHSKDAVEVSAYYDGYNYCVRPSPTADKSELAPEAAIVSDSSSEDDDSDSSSGG
eukprot:CAMPEP_0170863076 /NCGR_PEP_ID=MMETSP0734-20130129/19465_1 /TAXON_ID=186038 /ORGANISM="Fragilariopsis kerguelensis, Strain L26-C5" /LENGTH=64 /DNA_ID=CAMNT_0011238021 /DNA_START=14 /DNA_END=204 /DNA_ORIENTATION=+